MIAQEWECIHAKNRLEKLVFLCFAVKEQIYWHYFGEHIFHLMTEIFFSRKLAPA